MSIPYTGDPLWSTRDTLQTGDPKKQVVATDFRDEWNKISAAFALAAPAASPTFTGTATFSGAVAFNSTATFNSGVNITSGGLTVVGASTFTGTPTFTTGAEISSGANLTGAGGINITGNIYTSQRVTAASEMRSASYELLNTEIDINGTAGIPGELNVSSPAGIMMSISQSGIKNFGDPNRDRVSITVGQGEPTSNEPAGSLYLRTDGRSSSTLYIRAEDPLAQADVWWAVSGLAI